MRSVVDSNVPIAANGRSTHASLVCQLHCIEFIEELTSPKTKHIAILDNLGLLLEEYRLHLNYRGQPGLGDLFYRYLHDHMHQGERVIQVGVTPVEDEDRGFDELPINSVDKSDRKFLAAAIAGKARIVNALDSDWHEKRYEVAAVGVAVLELCPDHACFETSKGTGASNT